MRMTEGWAEDGGGGRTGRGYTTGYYDRCSSLGQSLRATVQVVVMLPPHAWTVTALKLLPYYPEMFVLECLNRETNLPLLFFEYQVLFGFASRQLDC